MDQEDHRGQPGPLLAPRSTTGASSATSARAIASCMRASAACASCAPARDDQIVLTTYGRSSGFCIDPIEKKPLNHFLPGTPVLSFGTAGCNLTCKFCQNWDISKARAFDRLQDRHRPRRSPKRRCASGCRSVAFTYNDPVIFLEYAVDVAQACRERGIKTVAVSAGYICAGAAARSSSGTWTPPISTSRASPRTSTRTCARASSAPCSTRSSTSSTRPTSGSRSPTLLIPGENDSPAEIEALSRWVMEHLGPTCRCISRPSIRTGRCWTRRRRRRRRCARRGASAGRRACATSTPATSTIRPARAHGAPGHWGGGASRSACGRRRLPITRVAPNRRLCYDPQCWVPVFERLCSNKKLEREDDLAEKSSRSSAGWEPRSPIASTVPPQLSPCFRAAARLPRRAGQM